MRLIMREGGGHLTRPLIHKPPLVNRDSNRDPNNKALERRGFINHGSTLGDVGT